MSNKKNIIFLIILSIFSISRVYGTSLIVKCERTVIRSHDHKILTCDRGDYGSSDDFVGDYHNSSGEKNVIMGIQLDILTMLAHQIPG